MSELICVTNSAACREELTVRIEKLAACRPGAVLLREKELSEADYEALAAKAKAICGRYGVRLILHSFTGVASRLGLGSIHLPMDRLRALPEDEKRRFETIGASVHSPEEAAEAERLGAGYVIFGNIFETPCKPGLPGRGIKALHDTVKACGIPVCAIGGLDRDNAVRARRAGAKGICVMTEAMRTQDPASYIAGLKQALNARILSSELRLYAITDNACIGGRDLCEAVDSALTGGATVIQLRDKEASHEELVGKAKALKEICASHGAALIVNDDWQAAAEAGADGAHVGIEDAPVSEIREKAGEGFIIGATAKTVPQALAAKEAGADYLGVGAVFPSPTKKNAIRITPELFREGVSAAGLPAVAIGGITLENITSLKDLGADGFAVVSAIFARKDIRQAAEKLRALSEGILKR